MIPHMVAEQLSAVGVNMENAWQKNRLEQFDRLIPSVIERGSCTLQTVVFLTAAASSAGCWRGCVVGTVGQCWAQV